MKTVTDIEGATGASLVNANNWMARFELSTHFLPATRGRPRRYTRQNALEIAVINAFVTAGIRPGRAVSFARGIVEHHDIFFTGPRLGGWFVVSASDDSRGIAVDNISLGALVERFPGALAFALIPIAEIIRRVDAYFAEHGEETED
jgi:hypothetical protein